jgi:hypothetical protein
VAPLGFLIQADMKAIKCRIQLIGVWKTEKRANQLGPDPKLHSALQLTSLWSGIDNIHNFRDARGRGSAFRIAVEEFKQPFGMFKEI